MNETTSYRDAVKSIKTAILQGQYEAAKEVNRAQLALYFAVGKYVSLNARKGTWRKGALQVINEQLLKKMPGLRGFSAESLKLMRRFYEEWRMLEAKDNPGNVNSAIAIAELQINDKEIDIFHEMQFANLHNFPVEDFFEVPFTHHSRIIGTVKTTEERYYYIHRCAEDIFL